MPIRKRPGEKKDEFVSRCIADEMGKGMKEDQASAVCYAMWEDRQLRAIKNMRKLNQDNWINKFLDNNKIGTHISELGLKMEDFTEEYRFDVDIEKFAIHESNIKDNEKEYYRYEMNYGGVGPAERGFCKRLMSETEAQMLFTFEDIVAMNNDPGKADRAGGKGYSVFKYRGGVNCQHKWVKYIYDTEKKELVKGKVQPSAKPVGYINK